MGLACSLYPFFVIDRVTIWPAASSPAALKLTLVGACISVSAIVGYTIFSYP
jgi:cytochrome d ubiquinol oxidase subunit II